MIQLICYRLFAEHGIVINPNNLLSQFENYTVQPDILKVIESSEFKDYFDFLDSKVEIIDSIRHPTGIMIDSEGWCRKNGKVEYGETEWEDGSKHKIITSYKANNENLIFEPIVDHASLLVETGKTSYQCIKTLSSEHFLKLKNMYKAAPVLIQQQSSDSTTQKFTNKGDNVLDKVRPTREGLANCKDSGMDCSLMLGIFSPYSYKESLYENWDLTKLRDYHREITVMLNRSGRSNLTMQMYFNGANAFFSELPYVDLDEQDQTKRNKQIDNMRKVYNYVEQNRQKELLLNN